MLKERILHRAYNVLTYLALPIILGRLAFKGLRYPEYYHRLGERLGRSKDRSAGNLIWVHAVSVGEVQAASSLLQALVEGFPQLEILVTTTTPTGSKLVQDKFAKQVKHCYLPYDLPRTVRHFLQSHKPALALFMETEIWPNIFLQCKQAGIPIMLLNARLSKSSLRGYLKIKPLLQASLNCCARILAQSALDAERFQELGAEKNKVLISGNLKFDIQAPEDQVQSGIRLRQNLWPARPVWIAASTHAREEEQILQAQAWIMEHLPRALLILAPRHPQRFDQVFALCKNRGFSVCRRSKTATTEARQSNIYLADSMGELFIFYAAADAAFVGGSLVHNGGHNLLEPASIGLPVLSGPYLHNFQEIARLLLEQNALLQVANANQLAQEVTDHLQNKDLASQYGTRSKQVVAWNQGALQFSLQQVSVLLQETGQGPSSM